MQQDSSAYSSYWSLIWDQFRHRRLGMVGLIVVSIFCIIGIYAPFLASSKPLVVFYDNEWYFPLFRYLFYTGFFTKLLDIFFNLLIFIFPLILLSLRFGRQYRWILAGTIVVVQFIAFFFIAYTKPHDPAADVNLNHLHQQYIQKHLGESIPTWNDDLRFMTPYAKLNLILRYQQRKAQNQELMKYSASYAEEEKRKWLASALEAKKVDLLKNGVQPDQIPTDAELEKKILEETPPETIASQMKMPTLWQLDLDNDISEIKRQQNILAKTKDPKLRKMALAKINFINDRRAWLAEESNKLQFVIMPLIRPFHWEDDAGGEQSLNKYIPWWDLTRINRKDLMAALIFGVRISLVVGITAVGLALIIGIPIGAVAGYYGGTSDIIVCRMLEIWESMPTFFMLLMVVAVTQSKSIFLVVLVIGIFGWTGFSRYIRGEFFKQRNLSYVEACRALGFNDTYIMFRHILPNAIPPLLTLLPFAVMGAITSEAGLSFLGLGEEGSCSWGVLMDEGRSAFPGESYLMWPPAILLTILLVAIALVGDSLRDALDPKMHQQVIIAYGSTEDVEPSFPGPLPQIS